MMPRAKIQHDQEAVYLIIQDEDGEKQVPMDASMAKTMGEALFKAGCKVQDLVNKA